MGSLSGEFWSGTASWPRRCLLLIRHGAEKKKSPCLHTPKLTKVLFDKHRDFLQWFHQQPSPFQTRGHRYDGCRDMTSIKCSVVWVQGPHKAWEWRWPWVLLDQAHYQWSENHQWIWTKMYYNKASVLMHIHIMDDSIITTTKIKATETVLNMYKVS